MRRKIGVFKQKKHKPGIRRKYPKENLPIQREKGEDILSWLARKAKYGQPITLPEDS